MPSDARQQPGPMLKAAGLWEKTSAAGNRYMVGRLGGVKILVLENRDRQSDADPSHNLIFTEAATTAQPRRPPPQDNASAQPSGSQNPDDWFSEAPPCGASTGSTRPAPGHAESAQRKKGRGGGKRQRRTRPFPAARPKADPALNDTLDDILPWTP